MDTYNITTMKLTETQYPTDSGGLGLEALEELVYNVRLQRRCNRKASLEPKVVSCFKMRFGVHHH
jgi:hypothetical protein